MGYSTLCATIHRNPSYNHSSGRAGNKVCKITPHHMGAVWTGERCAESFDVAGRYASSNYCIGHEGEIVGCVDENDRSWCSSSSWNDNRAVTVEVANESTGGDWPISDASWKSLVALCVDICRRYGFRLEYTGDESGTLTEHRMFSATDCPGPYLHARMGELASQVNAIIDGTQSAPDVPSAPSTPATPSTPVKGPIGPALLLDCDAGIKTWSEWARQLGLSGSDADGYINYQYTGNKKYLKNVSSAIYAWYKGCPGSPTVKAVQRRIGSKNVDGVWGAVDTENLKAYMREQWGYRMTTDGYGVFGDNTAYNVQHSLNKGFWRQ